MFGDLFNKASSILDQAKNLKDFDLSNPGQLLEQIKNLDFTEAKEKLSSLLPMLPLDGEQVSSLVDKLEAATANNETISLVIEKIKSFLGLDKAA